MLVYYVIFFGLFVYFVFIMRAILCQHTVDSNTVMHANQQLTLLMSYLTAGTSSRSHDGSPLAETSSFLIIKNVRCTFSKQITLLMKLIRNSSWDRYFIIKHHCSHRLNYGIFTNTDDNKEKKRKLSTSYRHG